MTPTTVIAIGAVIVVVVLIIAAISIRSQRSDIVDERLGRYTEASTFLATTDEEDERESKKKKKSALTERFEGMLQGKEFANGWRQQLARADLRLTVSEFLALHVISMIGSAVVAFFILFGGNIVLTIVFGGIGIFIPRIYL